MALPTICVFLKFPLEGAVKTRLAASIGPPAALLAYEELTRHTLTNLRGLIVRKELHMAPPERLTDMAAWLEQECPDFRPCELATQVAGDLGERLDHAVQRAFLRNPAAVTLIGTDCPRITPRHFEQAWEHLAAGADVVYGPCPDGGYYLQCLARPLPELFAGIPWSSPNTLAACLAKAGELGLSVALLEPLEDVDDLASWQRWCQERETSPTEQP